MWRNRRVHRQNFVARLRPLWPDTRPFDRYDCFGSMPNPSVLIVDADARGARVLEVSLKKAGFTVETVESGGAALTSLAANVPDVLIAEIRTGEIDGLELRRRMQATPALSRVPFLMLTHETAIEYKLAALELGIDEYLIKPVYIKEIIARLQILIQRRQRSRMVENDERTRFVGRLTDVSIVDLLQTIEQGKKSGVVQLSSERNRQAAIFFRDGKIIDAEAGALHGADAVYRLLTWSDGSYEVVIRTVRRREVIAEPTQALLLEGVRRLDEWSALLEQLPALTTRFEVDARALTQRLENLRDEYNPLLKLLDSKRTLIDVIERSALGDLETLQVIARLYADKVLVVTTVAEEPVVHEHSGTWRLSKAAFEETPSAIVEARQNKRTLPPPVTTVVPQATTDSGVSAIVNDEKAVVASNPLLSASASPTADDHPPINAPTPNSAVSSGRAAEVPLLAPPQLPPDVTTSQVTTATKAASTGRGIGRLSNIPVKAAAGPDVEVSHTMLGVVPETVAPSGPIDRQAPIDRRLIETDRSVVTNLNTLQPNVVETGRTPTPSTASQLPTSEKLDVADATPLGKIELVKAPFVQTENGVVQAGAEAAHQGIAEGVKQEARRSPHADYSRRDRDSSTRQLHPVEPVKATANVGESRNVITSRRQANGPDSVPPGHAITPPATPIPESERNVGREPQRTLPRATTANDAPVAMAVRASSSSISAQVLAPITAQVPALAPRPSVPPMGSPAVTVDPLVVAAKVAAPAPVVYADTGPSSSVYSTGVRLSGMRLIDEAMAALDVVDSASYRAPSADVNPRPALPVTSPSVLHSAADASAFSAPLTTFVEAPSFPIPAPTSDVPRDVSGSLTDPTELLGGAPGAAAVLYEAAPSPPSVDPASQLALEQSDELRAEDTVASREVAPVPGRKWTDLGDLDGHEADVATADAEGENFDSAPDAAAPQRIATQDIVTTQDESVASAEPAAREESIASTDVVESMIAPAPIGGAVATAIGSDSGALPLEAAVPDAPTPVAVVDNPMNDMSSGHYSLPTLTAPADASKPSALTALLERDSLVPSLAAPHVPVSDVRPATEPGRMSREASGLGNAPAPSILGETSDPRPADARATVTIRPRGTATQPAVRPPVVPSAQEVSPRNEGSQVVEPRDPRRRPAPATTFAPSQPLKRSKLKLLGGLVVVVGLGALAVKQCGASPVGNNAQSTTSAATPVANSPSVPAPDGANPTATTPTVVPNTGATTNPPSVPAPPTTPDTTTPPPSLSATRAPGVNPSSGTTPSTQLVEKPDPKKLADQAARALANGNADKALELAAQSIDAKRNVKAMLVRAEAFYAQGKSDKALDALDAVFKMQNNNQRAWFLRGQILWKTRRYQEGRAAFEEYLSMGPQGAEAEYVRGLLKK